MCSSEGGGVTHSLRVPGLHIYDKKFISLGDIYFLDSQHGTELSESQPSSLSQPVTVPLQRGVSATSPPSVVPLQHLAPSSYPNVNSPTLLSLPLFPPLSALLYSLLNVCFLPLISYHQTGIKPPADLPLGVTKTWGEKSRNLSRLSSIE